MGFHVWHYVDRHCAEKADLAPSDFSFSPKPTLRNACERSDCQGAIDKVDDTEIRRLAPPKNQVWVSILDFRYDF